MNNHLKAIAAVATALVISGGAALAIGSGSSGDDAAAATGIRSATTSTTTVDLEGSTPTTVGEGAEGMAVGRSDADGGAAQAGSASERLSGPRTSLPGGGTVEPLGTIDTSGLVPQGLDLAAFPEGAKHGTGGVNHQGPGSLSAGPGCAYQCIESGIAYPRGFGAELVVKTKVPADMWIGVVADYDGDGDYDDFGYWDWGSNSVKEQSWTLDHLEPGQTYYATVTATDEHGDTSYAYGSFTTLSHRTIQVSYNDLDIVGGPQNLTGTDLYTRIDGDSSDLADYVLGGWTSPASSARNIELALGIVRNWEGEVCEYADPAWFFQSANGDSDDSCMSWNTAVADVDVDRIPAGESRWTIQSFKTTVAVDDGSGGSLPPGYGDPRWFYASAEVSVYVTYS